MLIPFTTPLFFFFGWAIPQPRSGRDRGPRKGQSRYDIITGELISEQEADRREDELRERNVVTKGMGA